MAAVAAVRLGQSVVLVAMAVAVAPATLAAPGIRAITVARALAAQTLRVVVVAPMPAQVALLPRPLPAPEELRHHRQSLDRP